MRFAFVTISVVCFASSALCDEPVKLPAFEIQPKWQQWFPAGKPFFAEKYPEGGLQGMHLRTQSRLDGASVTLHSNGKLKSLGYYPAGTRQGTFRLWDDEGSMAFYGQFKDGKPQGLLCLFKEDKPHFVQHWDGGKVADESLVAASGTSYVKTNDSTEMEKARGEMDKTLSQLDKDDNDLRGRLRDWAANQSKAIDDAKTKAIKRAGVARMENDVQRARQEADSRAAAAHTHLWGKDRAGRVAAADARAAGEARKATANKQKNAGAEDKRNLENAVSEQQGESQDLYAFAMKSLDDMMPSESTESAASPSATRTFLVTYQEGKKNGAVHTDEIVATSPDDAKAKVRAYRPNAKFRKVVAK
jgi:antitoxin component YwqK of YwqJK toxin-antitoxin module